MDVLSTTAAEADASALLHPSQVAVIRQNHWFTMLAPRELGGGELSLPDAVKLEERISLSDGSCGWVVTLCAGAGWFIGFLPGELGRRIMSTPNVCLAGSGAPTGFADRDGDHWRISGRWSHATGGYLASHFTFNSQLRDAGLPMLDGRGQPRVQAFVVPAAQVTVEPDTWHGVGLRASASSAFSVANIRVPPENAFEIGSTSGPARGPLYRFPFEPLAFVTLAACISGMARHFLELALPLVRREIPHLGKSSAAAFAQWSVDEQKLGNVRERFHEELDRAWRVVGQSSGLESGDQQRVNESARTLATTALQVVDALYPYCGLHAADRRSDINRVWRDIHTASQHALWLR